MDYRQRQYWYGRRDEENARREAERERFRPLNDDELEMVREVYRLREARKRDREAQGCYCEHGPHSGDLPDWQTVYVLREPRRDCPLHSHLVPELEERKKQAEIERQAREREQQARELAEARERAVRGTVKGVFSYVFLWPTAVIAAVFVSFIIAIIPIAVLAAVLSFLGIAIGAIGWAALFIGLLIWFAPFFVKTLGEEWGLGIVIGVILWGGLLIALAIS